MNDFKLEGLPPNGEIETKRIFQHTPKVNHLFKIISTMGKISSLFVKSTTFP
jgi:hypothetical protein